MSEQLQNKMLNYEVTPPSAVWDKIAIALDESHISNEFSSALYHLEIAPPQSAWQQIETELNNNNFARKPAKVVPLRRYAVAASILAFVALGSLYLFSSSGKKAVAKGKAEIQVTSPKNNEEAPIQNQSTDEEARNDAALEQSKHTMAKLDASTKSKSFYASFNEAVDVNSVDLNPEGTYKELDYSNAFDNISQPLNESIASRYIMFKTSDGSFIRMSKKLSGMICCVSGEEQDDNCKDQMKKWREKIAASATHSPGNFLDIFNLVSSLQDNENF
jgi:hypothetical protein